MTTPKIEPHLIYTQTDRGFLHMPPVAGTYEGHQVKAYESSAASKPCLWLNVKDGDFSATAHLTVEAALNLADQLQFLARNHYQHRSGDPIIPGVSGGPPEPGISYEAMWDQLTGYVMGAVGNPKPADAKDILAFMRELRAQRNAPAAEWIKDVGSSAPSTSEEKAG